MKLQQFVYVLLKRYNHTSKSFLQQFINQATPFAQNLLPNHHENKPQLIYQQDTHITSQYDNQYKYYLMETQKYVQMDAGAET